MNDENVIDKLNEYKNRLERSVARNTIRLNELEENRINLSESGHWSLGYYRGIVTTTENLIDDLDELLGVD